MEAKYLKEIVKLSDIVRQKYRESKMGASETEQILQETFKPIVTPLKTLVSETRTNRRKPKEDKNKFGFVGKDERGKEEEIEDEVFETPKRKAPKFLKKEVQFTSTPEPTIEDYVENALQTVEGVQGIREYLNKLGHIAAKYIGLYITGDPKIDKTRMSIRNTGRELMIGNSKVEIDNNDLIIGGKEYEGSEGLYELLFMKNPDEAKLKDRDIENYKDILDKTSATRRAFSADLQRQGTKGHKYRKFYLGKAYKDYVKARPNFVYFDDINELVDRLKLLVASKDAGHTDHENEILSIIEELKEADIIG